MKWIFSTLILFSPMVFSDASDGDLQLCVEAINGRGYRGGGMQTHCENVYILPSPLTIRCAKNMDENGRINDPQMQALCRVSCASVEYYGPWVDYPMDQGLLEKISWMRQLNEQRRCESGF